VTSLGRTEVRRCHYYFDIEYIRKKRYNIETNSYNGMLIGTYRRPTEWCYFKCAAASINVTYYKYTDNNNNNIIIISIFFFFFFFSIIIIIIIRPISE